MGGGEGRKEGRKKGRRKAGVVTAAHLHRPRLGEHRFYKHERHRDEAGRRPEEPTEQGAGVLWTTTSGVGRRQNSASDPENHKASARPPVHPHLPQTDSIWPQSAQNLASSRLKTHRARGFAPLQTLTTAQVTNCQNYYYQPTILGSKHSRSGCDSWSGSAAARSCSCSLKFRLRSAHHLHYLSRSLH